MLLNKEISLEELHYVADQLAREKVPGRDGVPIEFYLQLWDEIRPILLEVLRAR